MCVRYVFLLIILFSIQLRAQDVLTVPTAVPFLRISPDPRAAGMADISLPLDPDPNSCFTNPAKLAFSSQKMGVGVSYTPWFSAYNSGQYLAALSFFTHLQERDALSFSLRYFNTGAITATDGSGTILSTYKPRDFSIDAAYGIQLNEYVSASTALRFIYSRLVAGAYNGTAFKAGKSVAADVSLYGDFRNEDGVGWTGGLSITNLGTKMSYTDNAEGKDFLPATLAFGIGHTFLLGDDNALLLAAQYEKLLVPAVPADPAALSEYRQMPVLKSWTQSFSNNTSRFCVGAEFDFRRLLYVRAGYSREPDIESYRNGFSAGIGLRLPVFNINTSYLVPSRGKTGINPMNNTLRFGVVFNFESSVQAVEQRHIRQL